MLGNSSRRRWPIPLISLFPGIRITMYYDNRSPAHIDAEYAVYKALVDIVNCCVIKGSLPNRQLRFVLAWTELHKDELMQNWELIQDGEEPQPIAPLA